MSADLVMKHEAIKRWRTATGTSDPQAGAGTRKIAICFDAIDFNQVRAIADAEGVTIASVMRRLVRAGLKSSGASL